VLQCAQVDFFQINDVSISAEDPPDHHLSTARVLPIFRPLVSWRTVTSALEMSDLTFCQNENPFMSGRRRAGLLPNIGSEIQAKGHFGYWPGLAIQDRSACQQAKGPLADWPGQAKGNGLDGICDRLRTVRLCNFPEVTRILRRILREFEYRSGKLQAFMEATIQIAGSLCCLASFRYHPIVTWNHED